MRLRIVCKWLNCLGYKWKEVQKGVFFDRHKRENMVEYRETFLIKMKSLLIYFEEFSENGLILPKAYPNDYKIKESDRKPIIIITYDENIFFSNNGY